MENHKFRETQKEITIPKMMDSFLTSKTYMIIMDFIRILQDSAKGKKKSDVPESKNPCIQGFFTLFDELEKVIKEAPLSHKEQRFGNTGFKVFRKLIEERYQTLISIILKPKMNEGLALELKHYFLESFGSNMRLDYGTGHELNFLSLILVLYHTGYYSQEDFPSLVVHVFFRYLLFVRKIQVTYLLEPAGAHGVWGLDEYQFLPFLFGAGQLMNNKEGIEPKDIHNDKILEEYHENYMYLSCIRHIKTVKHGASFGEYAPMLDSISAVPIWDKVAKGLVKMYEDEVLKKFVVMQHFYFGSILTYENK